MSWMLIQWLIVLLLWVGGWGITEMIIERVAKGDKQKQFALYILVLLLGIIAFILVDAFWPDGVPTD